jgi:hypothetical protein
VVKEVDTYPRGWKRVAEIFSPSEPRHMSTRVDTCPRGDTCLPHRELPHSEVSTNRLINRLSGMDRWSWKGENLAFAGGEYWTALGKGMRAWGGMWPLQCARASRRFQVPLALAFGTYGRSPGACDPPVPNRFDYKEGTMRGRAGVMSDSASVCCSCSVGLLRATVRIRRKNAARRAPFLVRRREDGTELDAPVPVLPTPYCTALDGQDFNACVPLVARTTALCSCNSWPPPLREGPDFGIWSQVFPDCVGIRKALNGSQKVLRPQRFLAARHES